MAHSSDYIDNRLDGDEADSLMIEEWLVSQDGPLPWSSWEWLYDWAHENPDAWPMVDLPEGMTEVEAHRLMVSRVALQGQRFNPNHGKDGKFTSGAGGGAAADTDTLVGTAAPDTAAGQHGEGPGLGGSSYEEMDHGEAVAEQSKINMEAFWTPSSTQHTMDMLAERQLDGVRVFKSGNNRAYVHKNADVDDEHLGAAFRTMDEMNTRFPRADKLPGKIEIQPSYKFSIPGHANPALAETVVSRPYFRFSDDLVMGRVTLDTSRTFHPKAFYRDPIGNVIAHEYGHSMMPDPRHGAIREHETFYKTQRDGLSRYGKSDVYEGYAEAFSDYATGSPAQWMPATKAYVEHYGWSG